MAHPEIARYTETNVTPAILVNSSSPTASFYPASQLTLYCLVTENMCSNDTMRIYFDRDISETSEFSIIENQFLCSFYKWKRKIIIFLKSLRKEKELRDREKVHFYLLQYLLLYNYTKCQVLRIPRFPYC